MADVNYYKHHIGDYAKKTIGLSMLEHGAYLLMLHAYYGTEKPLPFGRDLYRICRAFGSRERAAIDKVAELFWKRTEAGWINGRAFEEIEIAHKLRDIAVDNGAKGGRPKKPSGLSEINPLGSDLKTQRVLKNKAIQTPDSNIQTPLARKEIKTGGGESATRAPPTQLSVEFELTEERRSYAEDLGLDAKRAFDLFVNHFIAADGPKSFSRNWDARWRKWCLEDSQRAGIPRKGSGEAPAWLTAEERAEFDLAIGKPHAN